MLRAVSYVEAQTQTLYCFSSELLPVKRQIRCFLFILCYIWPTPKWDDAQARCWLQVSESLPAVIAAANWSRAFQQIGPWTWGPYWPSGNMSLSCCLCAIKWSPNSNRYILYSGQTVSLITSRSLLIFTQRFHPAPQVFLMSWKTETKWVGGVVLLPETTENRQQLWVIVSHFIIKNTTNSLVPGSQMEIFSLLWQYTEYA